MTNTIYVTESKTTTAEEHTRAIGTPSAPGTEVTVIATVRMSLNEHGKRVVVWELDDSFTLTDSQWNSVREAVIILNDRFNKELEGVAE